MTCDELRQLIVQTQGQVTSFWNDYTSAHQKTLLDESAAGLMDTFQPPGPIPPFTANQATIRIGQLQGMQNPQTQPVIDLYNTCLLDLAAEANYLNLYQSAFAQLQYYKQLSTQQGC